MCEECDLINSDRAVGSDEHVAITVPHAAIPAIKVIPKQHGPLSELTPAAQQRLLATANTLSGFIFERMEVQGTNVIVRDEEHAYVLVLGRTEQDGLDLRWQPKQMTRDEIGEIGKRISDQTWYIGKEKKEAPASYVEKTSVHPKRIERRGDPNVPDRSAKTRVGYEDPDPSVDTPDEIARDLNAQLAQGPKKDNYLVKHLTRRR